MKYVAFLRGINVGGKTIIKMEELRQVFSSLGFANVKSYIQSGNIVFETDETDDAKLTAKIESAVETNFFQTPVIIRSIDEIEDTIANNPFAGQFEDEKSLHVFFLDKELSGEKGELLLSNNNENELFAVRGREIFHLSRIRFPDTLAGKNYIGKKLKVSATARNWRTVNKILEL